MYSRDFVGTSSFPMGTSIAPLSTGGGGFFSAFSAIADANANWKSAQTTAFSTGDYTKLPIGTHQSPFDPSTTITKAATHTTWDDGSGLVHGITKDGEKYSYRKPC